MVVLFIFLATTHRFVNFTIHHIEQFSGDIIHLSPIIVSIIIIRVDILTSLSKGI